MTNKKYELTNHKYQHFEFTLYQIKALRNFSNIKAGQLGGYIQSEQNLSQDGSCWVYPGALVYLQAQVLDNAKVDDAWIFNSATVREDAVVEGGFIYANADCFGNCLIKNDACVSGASKVFDFAVIKEKGAISTRAWCHGHAEIGGCARAGGDVELDGSFKLRGTGRLYSGYYDKGVIEYYSPYLVDVSKHG